MLAFGRRLRRPKPAPLLGTVFGLRSRSLYVRGKKLDHPLIHEDNLKLRQRVIQLLLSAYSVMQEGNIIFVCGGNKESDMRPKFQAFCAQNYPEFDIFFPEYAMNDFFASGGTRKFNIADFEILIGELSHAIVLFPEAPGSFAEAGYFSVIPSLAFKTILAMDSQWQGHDSFFSMGPAMKINQNSRFREVMQIPYSTPEFDGIVRRINRFPIAKNKKHLKFARFKDLTTYEVFCLVYKCFKIMRIATINDIIFIFRALFRSQFSIAKVKQLASILVGAKYLSRIGEFGHYYVNRRKADLLHIRTGFSEDESEIVLELANIYENVDGEFLRLIEESSDAA